MALFRMDFAADSLQMCTSANVIIPDVVKPVNEMNVVYLLHGMSDNCTNWMRLTSIERYANERECIVIMPEVQRSMYTDMKHGLKYFTYIADELPKIMHRFFNISLKRENSFIAGLSMGGYGTLKAALTYPEKYEACAAFSSVCLSENFKDRLVADGRGEEMKGIYGTDLIVSEENDIFLLAQKANGSNIKPRIMMTCGTEDFLYEHNTAFRDHMKKLDFTYKYEEWQGGHTWDFWDKSIQMAFEFFFGE